MTHHLSQDREKPKAWSCGKSQRGWGIADIHSQKAWDKQMVRRTIKFYYLPQLMSTLQSQAQLPLVRGILSHAEKIGLLFLVVLSFKLHCCHPCRWNSGVFSDSFCQEWDEVAEKQTNKETNKLFYKKTSYFLLPVFEAAQFPHGMNAFYTAISLFQIILKPISEMKQGKRCWNNIGKTAKYEHCKDKRFQLTVITALEILTSKGYWREKEVGIFPHILATGMYNEKQ